MEKDKIVDELFPETKWNKYVLKVNEKIISLDSDKDAQCKYIFDEYHKMTANPDFNQKTIVDWFNFQMQLTGNEQFVHMFDASMLCTMVDLKPYMKGNTCFKI